VVLQDVTVSKVLVKGSTAVGVEYLEGNSSDPEVLLAAKEVILSAGVFASSKILMVRPFICLPSLHSNSGVIHLLVGLIDCSFRLIMLSKLQALQIMMHFHWLAPFSMRCDHSYRMTCLKDCDKQPSCMWVLSLMHQFSDVSTHSERESRWQQTLQADP
jgi:hypothetical protein